MNEIQKFPHLEQWCKEYYERVGLKVHPANVPVDVVLDDLMGHIMMLHKHMAIVNSTLKAITSRFESVDNALKETMVAVVELELKTGNMTLRTAEEVQAHWKEENKTTNKKVKK